MSTEEAIQDTLDELGVDVEITPETEMEVEGKPETDDSEVDLETREITIYKPYDPDTTQRTTNEKRKLLLQDGSQLVIRVHRRPRCPSCGYVPTQEGEPGHLTGRCVECNKQTCPRCKNTCETCGKILCPDHTKGHGLEDKTYCHVHAQDIEEEVQHRREKERREQSHKQKMDELEEERKKQKQMKELEIRQEKERDKMKRERKQEKFRRKIESEELKLQVLRMVQEARKRGEDHVIETGKPRHIEEIEKRADKLRRNKNRGGGY